MQIAEGGTPDHRGTCSFCAKPRILYPGPRCRACCDDEVLFLYAAPSEYSSGESRAQGSITKTGHAHVRRLLVEAAWHHRHPYGNPGRVLRTHWADEGPVAQARGHAG